MLTCHGEATVKNCTIGDNVTLGKGVKLSNCLVMSHVTIEDSCSLSNSVPFLFFFDGVSFLRLQLSFPQIICSHVTIGAHSTIKDTRIGEGYTLQNESSYLIPPFLAGSFSDTFLLEIYF